MINEVGFVMWLLYLNNNYYFVYYDLLKLLWYDLLCVYWMWCVVYVEKCGGFVICGGYCVLFVCYVWMLIDLFVYLFDVGMVLLLMGSGIKVVVVDRVLQISI